MLAPRRHPGSPQALAPRQFATPSSSGGSKYPPLSAFQPDGSAGGYYGGGDNYYAGKTIIRWKCPWKNFPEVSVIAMYCIGRNCVLCSRSCIGVENNDIQVSPLFSRLIVFFSCPFVFCFDFSSKTFSLPIETSTCVIRQ